MGGLLITTGCNKSSSSHDEKIAPEDDQLVTMRNCAAQDVLEEQLKADASLRDRMNAIEEFTQRFTQNPDAQRLVNGVVEIPVVVNVLYRTAAQNISQAQIQSQIDVLNKDFSATNSDYN